MKIKIEIKNRFTGKILFEFETENNTLKNTVEKAVKVGANLDGANLDGANLVGANLVRANLVRANLDGANLFGANLVGANLDGATYKGVVINKTAVFAGLYKYISMPIISKDGKEYIRLGCYTRLVSEWENDFWNNPNEFPNNGDIDSKYRLMAYDFCKKWLELNR